MTAPGRVTARRVTARRVGVVAVAVVIGVAIGGSIAFVRSGSLPTLIARAAVPRYEAAGRLVPLPNGRRLYLDCRGSGSPTVVLESGLGGSSDGWGRVFPDMAASTRTCVYDRAGLGRSDPVGRRSGSEAVADLWEALAAAGERGPYVLAGHSLGGVYVRLLAAAHPRDVAGVVLVDAFNPDLWVGGRVDLPADVASHWNEGIEATIASIQAVEHLDWSATMAELAAVRLGSIPVIALTQPDRWSENDPPLAPDVVAQLRAAWEAGLVGLSSDARHVVVAGTGHLIQLDRPDAVLAAIRELVERGRAR